MAPIDFNTVPFQAALFVAPQVMITGPTTYYDFDSTATNVRTRTLECFSTLEKLSAKMQAWAKIPQDSPFSAENQKMENEAKQLAYKADGDSLSLLSESGLLANIVPECRIQLSNVRDEIRSKKDVIQDIITRLKREIPELEREMKLLELDEAGRRAAEEMDRPAGWLGMIGKWQPKPDDGTLPGARDEVRQRYAALRQELQEKRRELPAMEVKLRDAGSVDAFGHVEVELGEYEKLVDGFRRQVTQLMLKMEGLSSTMRVMERFSNYDMHLDAYEEVMQTDWESLDRKVLQVRTQLGATASMT